MRAALLRPVATVMLLAGVACSSGSGGAPGGDVGGAWCGLQVTTADACVGDEPVYAEFAQAGTDVFIRAPSALATFPSRCIASPDLTAHSPSTQAFWWM